MTKLLQFLRLHPSLSVIYLGMVKCAYIVASFFITYGTISLTFSITMYLVLRNSIYLESEGEGGCDEELYNSTISTYTSLKMTFTTLVLSVFDPGNAEGIQACTEGISRVVGVAIWFLYYVVVLIVLFNILIALMNVVTNADLENGINTWKYHRTLLWMRYCGKRVVLPSPMNIIDLLITLPSRCFLRYS